MKRKSFISLLLFSLLIISGCNRMLEVVDVTFKAVTITEAPEEIRKAVKENRDKEKATVYTVDREVYIVITRGEKTTGGYSVEVSDIDKYILGEDKFAITVKVEYKDPEPGQPVTQAITYPFSIVKVDLKDIPMDTPFKFSIDGTEKTEYPVELQRDES